MKRDLSDSEEAPAKKLEQEKVANESTSGKQSAEQIPVTDGSLQPKEGTRDESKGEAEAKAESESKPESESKSQPESTSEDKPEPTVASPTLKSGNPLLSGTFTSSFGGKASAFSSSFGSSSGVSGFGCSIKPKENPWSEKKQQQQEEKEATPEPPKTDQYAVVALEKQETKTGEEEESTIFQARAKLYVMNLKDTASGWKERGVGTLHLNFSEQTSKHRVLMRTDTLHKVILNTRLASHTELHKGFQSSAQSAKFVRLSGAEADGSLYQYALRLQSAELANELFENLENAKK